MTVMETGRRYSGLLQAAPDADGVRATIAISDDSINIFIDDGEIFTYSQAQVRARPYDSRTVVLDIRDEDDLYFVADDPLSFAESGLAALSATAAGSAGVSARREDGRWRLPVLGTTLSAEQPAIAKAPERKRRGRRDRECRHDWRTLRLSGGLVRRVCNECGTVSIDLTG